MGDLSDSITEQYGVSLKRRWLDIQQNVALACDRVGRDPQDVQILAVSKTFPFTVVKAAFDQCGITAFGENYMQDCLPKVDQAIESGLSLQWHFIGHLQRNKAKYFDHRFAMLHSLDSLALAGMLSRQAVEHGIRYKALVQVNVADDDSKYGLKPRMLPSFIEEVRLLPGLQLCGLMTIPAISDDINIVRGWYRRLAELKDDIQRRFYPDDPGFRHLSMGMSDDYMIAVEEGATIIRVGTSLFGSRQSG